jgi:hypothetical protein
LKETRSALILKALATYREEKQSRTETIEFRGAARSFEVVTISPEVPLLNPNNSRLRAQLLGHPQQSTVKTDPDSPEAQKILSGLLAGTEKFDALKQQIVDYKQQQPGIISRDGLLVNGNTRLTAVRELGLTGFDVAVLPEDATDEDYFAIEMGLQLRKLVHQDYTFTNELLLVDNYLTRSENEDATIAAMHWKRDGKKKLRLSQGYLQLIEEIRAMNPKLTYGFFDNKRELISNLHQTYLSNLNHTPQSAETLKMTRIMGLFLGLNKDEIREMDEFFVEEIILDDLDGDELEAFISAYKPNTNDPDVLDELLGEGPATGINLRLLASSIAARVIDDDGAISDGLIDENFKKLHTKVRKGARQIREDRILTEMRDEPIEYLQDVTKRVQDLADRIPTLFRDTEFDAPKFQYQAKKTEKAIAALQDALDRTVEGKGED